MLLNLWDLYLNWDEYRTRAQLEVLTACHEGTSQPTYFSKSQSQMFTTTNKNTTRKKVGFPYCTIPKHLQWQNIWIVSYGCNKYKQNIFFCLTDCLTILQVSYDIKEAPSINIDEIQISNVQVCSMKWGLVRERTERFSITEMLKWPSERYFRLKPLTILKMYIFDCLFIM